ncbi:MAG TPA: SPFH domain-containing protein, partial [Sphingomonadales bacterium]|nr:SPFH domain-containing protein [Sphingomonadales bacterium]
MAWKQRGGNPWGSVPPAGGGRGGEGDDFIGRFQDRMGGLLPPFLKGRGFLTILLVLFVIVLLTTSFYRVQPAEQGVVQRFGEWVRTEPQGFHIKLPAPIETVTIVNVAEVRRVDVGFRTGQDARRSGSSALLEERLMLTGDENIV